MTDMSTPIVLTMSVSWLGVYENHAVICKVIVTHCSHYWCVLVWCRWEPWCYMWSHDNSHGNLYCSCLWLGVL